MSQRSISEVISDQDLFALDQAKTVFEAAQMMAEAHIGAILVRREGDIVGIMTERDILNKVVGRGLDYRVTTIGEMMSHPLITVTVNDSVKTCFEIMTQVGCRHLPVVKNDKIIGIISIRNVLDIIIGDLENMVSLQHNDLDRTNKILKTMLTSKKEKDA